MKETQSDILIIHTSIRLVIVTILLLLLVNSVTSSSGNNGNGINLMLFGSFFLLIVFGIYIVFETIKLLFKKQNNLVAVNLLLTVSALIVVYILGRNN